MSRGTQVPFENRSLTSCGSCRAYDSRV
ncbi:hypothetical protein LINPERHAP1_LOCUS40503 [Linum perenne]